MALIIMKGSLVFLVVETVMDPSTYTHSKGGFRSFGYHIIMSPPNSNLKKG